MQTSQTAQAVEGVTYKNCRGEPLRGNTLFFALTRVAVPLPRRVALLRIRTANALFSAPFGSPQIQNDTDHDGRKYDHNDNVFHNRNSLFLCTAQRILSLQSSVGAEDQSHHDTSHSKTGNAACDGRTHVQRRGGYDQCTHRVDQV